MFYDGAATWWQNVALGFLGLSAGGIIAAGVFAFLAIIGVFPRIMGRTETKRIFLYETLIILGGIWGNVSDLYEIPIGFGGNFVLGIVCGMSCDVSGRNFEGSSCNEPADWFGSRPAICDFVCGNGEACRGAGIFFSGDVPVE